MTKATKQQPKMWGTSIVGFGSYHYKYESGREGDSCLTGFSSRKGDISVYLVASFPGRRSFSQSSGSTRWARDAYTFASSATLISKSLSNLSSAPSQRGSVVMAKAKAGT